MLSDGDRIRNLLGTYCELIDRADYDGVAGLFGDDGVLTAEDGTELARGAAAIAEHFRSLIRAARRAAAHQARRREHRARRRPRRRHHGPVVVRGAPGNGRPAVAAHHRRPLRRPVPARRRRHRRPPPRGRGRGRLALGRTAVRGRPRRPSEPAHRAAGLTDPHGAVTGGLRSLPGPGRSTVPRSRPALGRRRPIGARARRGRPRRARPRACRRVRPRRSTRARDG